jgi:hypothetical protein
MASNKGKAPPQIQAIIDRLKFGQPMDTLCLFIPSHDRDNEKVEGQAKWAKEALVLRHILILG